MEQEVVRRHFRKAIPKKHQRSMDTRLVWLFNQRFGTVQSVYQNSTDIEDHTAASMILQCILAEDLQSIRLLYQRIEGGAIVDQEILDRSEALRV